MKTALIALLLLAAVSAASGSIHGRRAKPYLQAESVTAKSKGSRPQGNPLDTCAYAGAIGQSYVADQKWKPAFDTMHWYLSHCYSRAGYDAAWQLFGSAEGSLTLRMSKDSLQLLKTWLLSERNLNPADGWYCDCIAAFQGVYQSDDRASLAIFKFMIDNPRCAGNPEWGMAYENIRRGQISVWADTAKNNDMKYFDSSLPSMHELGLDSLLMDAAVGTHYEASGPSIIGNVRITANPFVEQTSLSISVNREAYVQIEVFDLLGRKLEGVGYSGVFEQSVRQIPINLTSVASGSYYVRISTANNETRTMKIAKE